MIWILTILSAGLYRIGGSGWFKRCKAVRRFGCPLIGFFTILFLNISAPWYAHLISYGLYATFVGTYFDEIFGYDNLWVHGLACALAYLPYTFFNHFWWQFGLRSLVCCVTIGGLNYLVNKFKVPFSDWIEECGRGFLLTYTIILFKIKVLFS